MIKNFERVKFKKIMSESLLSERKNAAENVEKFITSLDKNKWNNKFFAIYWPLKFEVDLRALRKKYPIAPMIIGENFEIAAGKKGVKL